MRSVTVKDLVKGSEKRLGLTELSVSGLRKRVLHTEIQRYGGTGPLGFDQPLIVTVEDIDRLVASPRVVQQDFLKKTVAMRIPFVILAQAADFPRFLGDFSGRHEIPFLCSSFDESLLETRLIGVLREKLCNVTAMHGGLIEREGCGILIMGESGVGKTTCSCEMVGMGYRWVADDVIVLEKGDTDVLFGRCHDRTRNLLEIKGRGIVRADDIFGPEAVCERTAVDAIVVLRREYGTFNGVMAGGYRHIMGVALPVIHMPVSQGPRDTAVHVDRAVRTFLYSRELS